MARNRSKVVYRGLTAYFDDSREAEIIQRIINETDEAATGRSIADGFLEYDLVWVQDVDDLPDCVGDVITLEADTTYYFTGTVDLNGCRLVAGSNSVILGASSENSRITSTGLGAGIPLLTSDWTLPVRHVTFQDVDTAIQINGATNAPVALDWTGVNFLNVPNIGEIDTCDNFIFTKGAFLNSQGLTVTGTVGTLGFDNSIYVGDGSAGSLFHLDSGCTITRRFRVIYSSFVAFGSTVAVTIDPAATIPVSNFILDTCNFSGGGTYLSGYDYRDNEALFVNNFGITNSREVAQYYMNGNTTATTISSVGVAVKAAGTTTDGSLTSKFSHSANRATYTGAITRIFTASATMSLSSGSNDLIGCYFAKNGTLLTDSEIYIITDTSGDLANVKIQTLVELATDDYLEIWVENDSATANITVSELNVIIQA